jgi:hypothetical protein
MKKILSLILVFTMVISLSGCTDNNASLYDAFKNMQEVTSLETETSISFKLEGEGLGEMEQMQLNQVAQILNTTKFDLNQRVVGNEDNTKAKSQSELNINFMGMEIPIKMWADIDLETSDMKTIISIPQILLSMMQSNPAMQDVENPLIGKEYLIYDIGKMMEMEDENIDFKEMMEFQEEFQPKVIKFMEDIQKDLKLDSDIIELQEEKEVDGEKIKVYSIKLNDESLRELVKELVDYILENDSTKEFIVEYMNGYMDTMMNMGLEEELSDEELEELKEDMQDMEEELDEGFKEMKEEFDIFMEKYKDVKILGEEGINILYSINKDGYIVETDGVMDFSIDLEEIAKVNDAETDEDDLDEEEMLYPAPEMKGKVNFKINYNTKNTNINDKDMEIKMPETTEENSIDLYEMMQEEMEKQMEMMEEFENVEDPEE